MMKNLRQIGAPQYNENDKEFARKIQETLGLEPMKEPYEKSITEPENAYNNFHPADDVNEFTWHSPSVRLYVSKSLIALHNYRYPRWVVSALCGTGATHRMGETAAKVLAVTGIEIIMKPDILKEVKDEFEKRKSQYYEAPLIPKGLEPPIDLRWPEWIERPGSQWWIPP